MRFNSTDLRRSYSTEHEPIYLYSSAGSTHGTIERFRRQGRRRRKMERTGIVATLAIMRKSSEDTSNVLIVYTGPALMKRYDYGHCSLFYIQEEVGRLSS